MKLIKISTDLEMTIHEFPEVRRQDAGRVPAMSYEEQNDYLRKLIGNQCRIYEHVMWQTGAQNIMRAEKKNTHNA